MVVIVEGERGQECVEQAWTVPQPRNLRRKEELGGLEEGRVTGMVMMRQMGVVIDAGSSLVARRTIVKVASVVLNGKWRHVLFGYMSSSDMTGGGG